MMTSAWREGVAAASEFTDAYEDQRFIRGALFSEPLGAVPRREHVTVQTGTSVAEAIRAMNDSHVGCALVVGPDGKLVGIFTERDVLRQVAGASINIDRTAVGKLMTPAPDTLPATASIAFALRKMTMEGYRHIPLLDEAGRPVGVVSVRDIVSWLVDFLPEGVDNLLPPDAGFSKRIDGG